MRAGGRGGGGRPAGHGPLPTLEREPQTLVSHGDAPQAQVCLFSVNIQVRRIHGDRKVCGCWRGRGRGDCPPGGGALWGEGNVLEAGRGGGSTTLRMC